MTSQEFLQQITIIQKRIAVNKRRVEQMQELLLKITPSLSDMPKSGTNAHAFEERIATKIDLEKEIERDKIRLSQVKLDVIDAIMMLDGNEERKVLMGRYIDSKTWTTIAEETGYTDRHIFRVHQKALKELEVPRQYHQ